MKGEEMEGKGSDEAATYVHTYLGAMLDGKGACEDEAGSRIGTTCRTTGAQRKEVVDHGD